MYILFLIIPLCFYNYENVLYDFIKQLSGYYLFAGNSFKEWYIPALILIYISFPLIFKIVKRLYDLNEYLCYILIVVLVFSYCISSDCLVEYFARRLYIPIIAIYIYLSEQTRKSYLSILIFTGVLQLFTPQYWGNYLYLPLLLYLIIQLKYKYPLYNAISFIGKRSLEIYLGQTVGIIYYCTTCQYDGRIKLLCGLLITIIMSFVFYYFQKGFYKLLNIYEIFNYNHKL